MPIEIREIVIRAPVSEAGSAGSTGGDGSTSPSGNPTGPEIMQECLEQVFQAIADKKER